MLRRAGTRRPLHAGLRGGGDADDIVHVNLSTPASPPDNSPVLSEANDADSEPENLHAPPITRATSYLTRVLSVVMDNSNASEWNSSLPQTVDPVTVQHLLEEEIREMAVESLGTHVRDAQAALRPAIDAALNATAQNALDKTSDGGVAEEEDGPPSWMDRLAPWLTVVSEYLPGVLFFAGSVCFLLAGIYYMEKMNIGIGPMGKSRVPTSFTERFMSWTGSKRHESKHFLPVVYVVAGYVLSNWIALSARRNFSSIFMMDQTTGIFLQAVVKYAVILLGSNAALKAMGYNIGLDTLVTSSSIAVGFASQSVLQNFAAGFGILLFRPFKVGDRVCIKEHIGTVTKVMIYETMILTDDGRTLIFPNREISAQVMENYSTHGWRRVHVPFYTAASSNVTATRAAVLEVLADYDHLWRPALGPIPPPTDASQHGKRKGRKVGFPRSPSNVAMLKDVLSRSNKRDGILSKVLRLVESEGGESLSTVPGDVIRQVRLLWDHEQRFAKPAPPMLIMLGLTEKGYLWRAMVWTPAPEHDGNFVRITEAIAQKLQECGIKLFSQALERSPADSRPTQAISNFQPTPVTAASLQRTGTAKS